jgi:hypothetical protein
MSDVAHDVGSGEVPDGTVPARLPGPESVLLEITRAVQNTAVRNYCGSQPATSVPAR